MVSWVGISLVGSLLEGTSAPAESEDDDPRSLPEIDGPMPVRGAVVDRGESAEQP